jgi:hypothetical protein
MFVGMLLRGPGRKVRYRHRHLIYIDCVMAYLVKVNYVKGLCKKHTWKLSTSSRHKTKQAGWQGSQACLLCFVPLTGTLVFFKWMMSYKQCVEQSTSRRYQWIQVMRTPGFFYLRIWLIVIWLPLCQSDQIIQSPSIVQNWLLWRFLLSYEKGVYPFKLAFILKSDAPTCSFLKTFVWCFVNTTTTELHWSFKNLLVYLCTKDERQRERERVIVVCFCVIY